MFYLGSACKYSRDMWKNHRSVYLEESKPLFFKKAALNHIRGYKYLLYIFFLPITVKFSLANGYY